MKADGGRDINNPKVPLAFVREYGERLYSSVGKDIEKTIPAKPSKKKKVSREPYCLSWLLAVSGGNSCLDNAHKLLIIIYLWRASL